MCDSALLEGACNGDSGGALFGPRNGGYVQIGVVCHGTYLLCGYASWLNPNKSAEVNAPSIRNFIRSVAGV